jgi:IS30 family transposase
MVGKLDRVSTADPVHVLPGDGYIQRLKNSHVVTLVERHSRFTALVKVPSKDTAVVVAALTRQVRNPRQCAAP